MRHGLNDVPTAGAVVCCPWSHEDSNIPHVAKAWGFDVIYGNRRNFWGYINGVEIKGYTTGYEETIKKAEDFGSVYVVDNPPFSLLSRELYPFFTETQTRYKYDVIVPSFAVYKSNIRELDAQRFWFYAGDCCQLPRKYINGDRFISQETVYYTNYVDKIGGYIPDPAATYDALPVTDDGTKYAPRRRDVPNVLNKRFAVPLNTAPFLRSKCYRFLQSMGDVFINGRQAFRKILVEQIKEI